MITDWAGTYSSISMGGLAVQISPALPPHQRAALGIYFHLFILLEKNLIEY